MKEQKLLPLEAAIHKMTGATARALKLAERGLLTTTSKLVFNDVARAGELREAIRSVKAQTLSSWELLVVDGASTANTGRSSGSGTAGEQETAHKSHGAMRPRINAWLPEALPRPGGGLPGRKSKRPRRER